MRKAVFLILAGLALASCGGADKSCGAYTIATLKGPSAMGMIRMIDSQTDSSAFRIEVFSEPMQVRKMMLDGTADFAALPTTMAAILYNSGIGYRLAAIPVWSTLYLVGNDMDDPVKTWQDLKGRRVFVMAKSMTPDLLFRHLLLQNGLDPDRDLILDYSFPTHVNLANAIAAGQAGLGIMTEPFVSLIVQRNKSVRTIFDLGEEWDKVERTPLAETAFLVKDGTKPEIVDEVLSLYEESTGWVNLNPEEAAALVARHGILPDSAAALRAIPNTNLKVVRAAEVASSVKNYLQVFYDMNPETVGGKIPDEEFIYQ